MTLFDYCIDLVAISDGNIEHITEALIAGIESNEPEEQRLCWQLLRQVGGVYSRKHFQEAAALVLEIADNDGPRAA